MKKLLIREKERDRVLHPSLFFLCYIAGMLCFFLVLLCKNMSLYQSTLLNFYVESKALDEAQRKPKFPAVVSGVFWLRAEHRYL